MEYRHLGKSGLQVSLLSFGSWLTFGKQVGDNVAEECMVKAYDLGINFFDNAEIYSNGQAEIVMGNILKKLAWGRDTFVLSSKAFFGSGGKKPNQCGLSRKHLMEACHAALTRLQVDYLDLYYCHRPDPGTPIEEVVFTMNTLINQGKVFYWGTSEWSAQEITEAHGIARQYNLIPPSMEQPQYNLFHRQRVEVEYAKLYKDFGMGTTIWSPLASGLLSGKYTSTNDDTSKTRLGIEGLAWLREKTIDDPTKIEKVKQLNKLAKEAGITTAQLALGWCIKNPNVSTAILGASKVAQLEENVKVIDLLPQFTPMLMQQIEEIVK